MESGLEDIKITPIYESDMFDEDPLITGDLSPSPSPPAAVKEPEKNKTEKKFSCPHCSTPHLFKSRSGLLRHEKKCHPEVPRRWKKKRTSEESEFKTAKNVICREDDCGFRCYKIGQLRRHLQAQHDFDISPPETLLFDSMSSFEVWKKSHELATQSKFVRRWTRADGAHEFLCNRSGSYRSQSKGFRQPRLAGSLKSGGHCTARIILFNGKSKPDLKNGIEIIFYPTHYGHSIYTSMNKRKIMQENKRKQRVLATALATEKKEIIFQKSKAKREAKSAMATATAPKKRRSAASDYHTVIQEIESNLQSIKTMQTKSLAEDNSMSDDFKLNFLIPENTEDEPDELAEPLITDLRYTFENPIPKSGPLPMRTFELSSWDNSSQTDLTMGNLSEEAAYGKVRKQTENITFAPNNCVSSPVESHVESLNMEMDRLYSLKPYLSKISNTDDSTRILTLVNFVHDSIVEVLAQNI